MKKKIIYPFYINGELIKDGSINGKPCREIYKQCGEEATAYVLKKFPHLVKATKEDKREIKQLWSKLSKEAKESIKNTKVLV